MAELPVLYRTFSGFTDPSWRVRRGLSNLASLLAHEDLRRHSRGGPRHAAGRDLPKILTPLSAHDTIWSILHAKLAPLVDHIHLVLSPDGAKQFPALPAHVSASIQPEPIGMGDAIFGGFDIMVEIRCDVHRLGRSGVCF